MDGGSLTPQMAGIASQQTGMPLSAFQGAKVAGMMPGAPGGGLGGGMDFSSILKAFGGGGAGGGGLGGTVGGMGGAAVGTALGGPAGGMIGDKLGSAIGGLFGGGGKASAPPPIQFPTLNNQMGPQVQPIGAQAVGNAGPLTGGMGGGGDLAALLQQIFSGRR